MAFCWHCAGHLAHLERRASNLCRRMHNKYQWCQKWKLQIQMYRVLNSRMKFQTILKNWFIFGFSVVTFHKWTIFLFPHGLTLITLTHEMLGLSQMHRSKYVAPTCVLPVYFLVRNQVPTLVTFLRPHYNGWLVMVRTICDMSLLLRCLDSAVLLQNEYITRGHIYQE